MYSLEKQEKLRAEFPDILWSFNEKNGGFAYGMNRGLAMASGDYLIITNPDVKLLTAVDEAVCYLTSHPEVGALGPQILDENGVIQDSARDFMLPMGFFKRQIRRLRHGTEMLHDEERNYHSIQPCDWVIGAFIIFSESIYRVIGGLDENYFLYVEDMDFCLRIRLAERKIIYYPPMKVQYKGDRKSTAAFAHHRYKFNKYIIYHGLSYLRFIVKHYFHVKRLNDR
jgi:GT2 family glycosyltransferase